MRCIVLGGAGDVGSRVVDDLATTPGVTLVTIADRNLQVAEDIQAQLLTNTSVTAKVEVAQCDAFNHESLVSAITGHDVCASALGPFHLFEVRCARASIEAGVRYCSVCDDWNAAGDVIDELHDFAKEKGVTCVTGFGATPGISNMGAVHLARTMDEVTDIQISCFQPLNAGGGEAVLRHMLFVMSGQLPIWRDGRKTIIQACGRTHRQVPFPRHGKVDLWNMGHSEPVTMYRYMPSLRSVEYRMGFGFGSRLLIWPAYLGLFKFAWCVSVVVWFFGLLDKLMKRWPKGKGALRVDVFGIRHGEACTEMMCGEAEMRESTGLSLSVGALMLGKGEGVDVSAGGVFGPEAIVEPSVFIPRLLTKGSFVAYGDVEMTRKLDPSHFTV
jgi:hypothetical protein